MKKRGTLSSIILLILSGECIYILPYVLARVFRPTFLDVFNLTNFELGSLFTVYGIVAIFSYIFGGVTILQMNLQAFGLRLPGQFFNMAPYLATMVVLVLISSNKLRIKLSAPASLTIPFFKGR